MYQRVTVAPGVAILVELDDRDVEQVRQDYLAWDGPREVPGRIIRVYMTLDAINDGE